MASLQKTYTGDLSTAIAGKLWEAIKDANEKNELEKTNASKDVKQAAVKAKKEDPESVPVRDMDLRETVVKFFTPIDGKLIKAQSTYSAISSKVTSLAGGVADTQKLLINQNQVLEDKFDQILNAIGTKKAIEEKLAAENKFKQLEMNLESALDHSGTFSFDKIRGKNNIGILGSLLQGIIGNRMASRLMRNLYRRLPRGLRARARLLRKSVKPLGRITKFAMSPVKVAVKATVNTALKALTATIFGKKGAKFFSKGAKIAGRGALAELVGRTAMGGANRGIRKGLRKFLSAGKIGRFIGDIPNYIKLIRQYGTANADKITNKIINEFATKATILNNQASRKAFKKRTSQYIQKNLFPEIGDQILGKAPRVISKTTSKSTAKKLSKKAGSKVATSLSDDILSNKGLISAFKNPIIQRKLTQKLGKEGMDQLLIKAGTGSGKTFAPGLGTLYAFGEGLGRISPLFGGSDPLGMLLSFGSAIPYGGWGVVMADILRDIDREAFDAHILPNLVPYRLSEEHINAFFMQALELNANQFERGTPNISPNMLKGVDPISEILGVTKAFGEATGFGAEVGGLIGEAGLNSYPSASGNYIFDVSGDVGGSATVNTQSKEAELRKQEEPEKEEEDDDDDDDGSKGPSAGEIIMKFLSDTRENIGAGVQYVDESLDTIRQWTGGKRDDGYYQLWNWKIKNFMSDVWKNGDGGDPSVVANDQMLGGSGTTIEFHGQQGEDLSGEPGVDFSFSDYKNNYSLFPGTVLETGLLYGSGYGNVVVVRSIDPSNGKEFDALYSHFPDGGIAVSPGQQVSAGQLLGAVGFVSVDTPGVPQLQPNNAGNMSGWHTSVDFFEPGSAARYSNADAIIKLIMSASGSTPNGLLERLKPTGDGGNVSALNNVEANKNLATSMTNLVENGSSERLMTQRQASSRLPIVIINNQIVNTSQNSISFGGTQKESNFFEAYNLARYTV